MGFGLRLRKPKHLGLRNLELREFREGAEECGGGGARTARRYWRALSWTRSQKGPRPRSRGPSRASGVLGAADRLSALFGGPVWVWESTGGRALPPVSPTLPCMHRRPRGPSGAQQSRATKDLRWEQAATAVRAPRLPKQTNQRLTHRRNNSDIVFRHLY